MISYFLDVLTCATTVAIELISILGLALLIQLISYQCFGINLYQRINKVLNRFDQYLTNKF